MGERTESAFLDDAYKGMSIYEYQIKRAKEKKEKGSYKLTEKDSLVREYTWNHLFKNDTQYNSYQRFRTYTFLPKPNPKDIEENEGALLLYEAQRRFLQYKNPEYTPGIDLKHLDLTSAYAVSLAGLDKSLKFYTSYETQTFENIEECFQRGFFHIVDVKLKMPYVSTLHLYAPNNRIKYKGKVLSDFNIAPQGAPVTVSLKLLQSDKLGIHSLEHFLKDLENECVDYEIVNIKITAYQLIQREALYEFDTLYELMQDMKKMPKEERSSYKGALVSFTGMLMNIDPGMRLLMLGRCEEVIHQIRNLMLESNLDIWGIQIDGIYYTSNDNWERNINLAKNKISSILSNVYRMNINRYGIDEFLKIKDFTAKNYKETPFRLQEVR